MYILLYSKYSRSCLRLLDNVDEINRMTSTPMVQLVCIDNKQTRKQILSSKAIDISKVPCLLILNDTTVEKYDGEKAFEWVAEVIQKLKVQSQSQPQPPPPPQTVIEINPEVQSKTKQTQSRNEPAKKAPKKTKIEDLDELEDRDDNNEEEEEIQTIKRPPIPIRNGAGSYSLDDTFSEPENDRPDKKSNNSNSKGGGILDLAMAMRQEREKENKDNNK